MEAPSSGSGGPRAGSAAASGGPRAGSGASGGHALALADPEVARFLELEPAERSVEFHMIMTELVTEATEYQITNQRRVARTHRDAQFHN